MDTSLENSVRCLLHFGFPPDFDRAERYLHELLDPAAGLPPQGHRPMHEVLEEIVGHSIEQAGTARIVIPLSEGLDSRALLAAALRRSSKERLLCVTFGRKDDRDVAGAREVAARLGVEWRWIDVADVRWSIPEIVERVAQVFDRLESYAGQSVVRQLHIERVVGEESLFLTGFLGNPTSGDNLNDEGVMGRIAIDKMLVKCANHVGGVHFDTATFAVRLLDFAQSMHREFGSLKHLTHTDVVDFGFRQSMRFRGTVGAYRNLALPFEDPRWVRYWLDQSVSDRRARLRYARELRASYPDVFILERDRRPLPVNRTGIRKMLRRYLRPAVSLEQRLKEKAKGGSRTAPELLRDFQINSSARETYVALMDSFDRRGLVPEVNFSEKLKAAMTEPLMSNVDYFVQAGRVEAHLQAGTLGGGTDGLT